MCKEFELMLAMSNEYDACGNHEKLDFDTFEYRIYELMRRYIRRVQFNPTNLVELVDFLNEHELPDVDRDGFEQVVMVARQMVDERVVGFERSFPHLNRDEAIDFMLYCIKNNKTTIYA